MGEPVSGFCPAPAVALLPAVPLALPPVVELPALLPLLLPCPLLPPPGPPSTPVHALRLNERAGMPRQKGATRATTRRTRV
jgi:hypothetical protein